MVTLSIDHHLLRLEVHGLDRLWAFKSALEIPLAHISGIRADPGPAREWWHGVRMPGTNLPGVLTAGTFWSQGQRVFWDVHDPEKAIVMDLHDDRYQQLIVEVHNPEAAVRMVGDALKILLGQDLTSAAS